MSNILEAPEGVRLGNEKLVLVTAAAATKLSSLIEREQKGNYLRVKITGGGCNGLSYKMKFVGDPKRGDILVRSSGAQILVDTKSALYLRGTQLDYSNEMVGGASSLATQTPSRAVVAAKALVFRVETH